MHKTFISIALSALIFSAPLAAAPQQAASDLPASAVPADHAASAPEILPPGINSPATPPDIAATAYLVRDLQSGQTLASQNADTPIEPASLTKIMTAYLVFKALDEGRLQKEQMLNVSENAWKVAGSRMFLNPNTPVSADDLIKGMVVQSANDAAMTLAETLGQGSVDEFVKQMNAEAQRLGMGKTVFKNPTGLPEEGHLSTAADLITLAGALIRDYPQYYPVYSLKSFAYNHIEQPNRNLLLYRDSSVDGMQIGFSETAGYHQLASSKRNGRRILSAVIGADSTEARAAQSSKLLNWALQAFDTPRLYRAGSAVSQVKVYKGSSKTVSIGFLSDAYMTLPRDSIQNMKPILETFQPVLAPIQKGQMLGTLKMVQDGKVIAEKEVVALDGVQEANWFWRTWDSIVLWFKNLFGG
ncbi:D-alanyl-D-alanine carboxypeptidase family protein [Neisseria animalis]|uniref:serine-type D-Ala-D-Ala carboxypeptidase n=1 Tax=Neisseria animalis TaxID=492 RepID=A0A5P3MTG0_NEIAN|nr:D-alanyl-D-alanine carboxypeptidase family protein [Neisseria animalis]QEY24893.1 D-alanyl-D-alanine carboxypeptidase [Neisseria animalis]ROW32527.1 D-alanyl-D-alanine carboxypeptidase [Neisseria animalis]